MKRRDFILNSIYAGLAISVVPLYSCKDVKKGEAANNPTNLLADNFSLNEITIHQLQRKMQSGELSSKQIVELYLERIKQIDKDNYNLNAVIEINPDALSIAETMDNERKAGNVRGLMHGIPILIKDNIDTADKMMTTAGSLALVGNIATKDAFIVDLLRKSGAVILGKTNLSEFANFRSTRSVSGWSSRGGQTKNPYVLDRNPCGSSSGSGAAVAANLCAVAIGTETDGSIICPSTTNGIVGIKPTVGLVSRSGIIPISFSQDTAGPMARTVTDAAIVLGCLAGEDTTDDKTKNIATKALTDYTQFLVKEGLTGKRIGIAKSALKISHEKINALMVTALEQIKSLGAEVIEYEDTAKNELSNAEYEVLLYEFKDGLNNYLTQANAKVKSLAEIIAFNKANEKTAMPYFQQEILESSQAKGDLTSSDYIKSLKISQQGSRDFIDKLLKKYALDAICGISNGPAWCTDLVNGDKYEGYGMVVPYALAGYPAINVPLGSVEELPVGLVFTGKAWDEPTLISIAYSYEQISQNRKSPKFKNSVG